jgi:hypothetical protein
VTTEVGFRTTGQKLKDLRRLSCADGHRSEVRLVTLSVLFWGNLVSTDKLSAVMGSYSTITADLNA